MACFFPSLSFFIVLYAVLVRFIVFFFKKCLLLFALILKTEALKNLLKILNANNMKDDKNAPAQEWSV